MRLARSIVVILLATLSWSAGEATAESEKYADARETLGELSEALGVFVKGMDEAKGNQAMAACLNRFTDVMKPLAPRIKAMNAKYPELTDEKTHPEELEPILSKIDKGFLGMMKAYARITAAIEDPVMREADKRYREAMAGLK